MSVLQKILKIGIQGDSKSLTAATKEAARGVTDLGRTAKTAGRDLDTLDQGLDKTAERTRRLGGSSEATGRQVNRLGREAERLGATLSNDSLMRGAELFVNKWSALAGGYGVMKLSKDLMSFNHELRSMGIAAQDAQGSVNGKSLPEFLEETKGKILDVSIATGQSREQLLGGMRAIIGKTGNVRQAVEQIELLGQAATASGSAVEDMGALASQLDQKAGVKGVTEMRKALTLLVSQGKSGSFEMRDMVSQGERLFSVMGLYGQGGMEGLKSFGAMIQMARSGTGSPEQATTAVERLGQFMSNVKQVQKHLAKVGINVQLNEGDSVEANLKKIIATASGKFGNLAQKRLSSSQAFGEEGMRLVNRFVSEYAAGRGFDAFEGYKQAGGDLEKNNVLMRDFASASNDAQMQMARLNAVLEKTFNQNASGPIKGFTDLLIFANKNAKDMQLIMEAIGRVLLVSFGAVAAKKTMGWWGARGTGAGGMKGIAGAIAAKEGSPVFVTNWPMGGMGGNGNRWNRYGSPEVVRPGSTGSPGMGGPQGRFGGWGGLAMGAGLPFLASTAENLMENDGAKAGWAEAGVALGTSVGFVLGGPMGAWIGSTIGKMAGETWYQWLEDAKNEEMRKKEVDRELVDKAIQEKGVGYARATMSRSMLVRESDFGSVGSSTSSRKTLDEMASSLLADPMRIKGRKSFADEFSPQFTFHISTTTDASGRTTTEVKGEDPLAKFNVYVAPIAPEWAR